METLEMTKEQFFANYEFEDQPVNGFNEPFTEDQIIELMEAWANYLIGLVKSETPVLWSHVKNVMTEHNKL